jgi:hypothetical protein
MGVNTIVLEDASGYLYGRIMALRRGFGAPKYPVKPYSIALAVSVSGAAILLMAAGWIYGRPEAGKPYFCAHSQTSKTSILWH